MSILSPFSQDFKAAPNFCVCLCMNPYVGKDGRWYFYDEAGDVWGPFNTEAKAKKALDAYCRWLGHGPTLWQRTWWSIKKLIQMKTAESILITPIDEPERIFKQKDSLSDDYKKLLKIWHPDINHDPLATKVAAHLQALYNRAQEKLASKIWNPPGSLELTGKDGKLRKIKYRAKRSFELGDFYVGDSVVTFVVPRTHEDLVLSGLRGIGTIRYPNEEFRRNLEPYFPKVEHYFETPDSIAICMRKRKDEILLSDLIGHQGGKIDPKHVAWIMSSLFNLASFLHITEMTMNGISPQTVFVSTPTHSLSILGGWWYSKEYGHEMKSLPPDAYKLAPRKLLISKKASPFLDLECIRAVGRACLGDASGNSFRMNDDIPKPMAEFLLAPSSENAVKEYELWMKVLEKSFGPRKFIKLEVLPDHIYGEGSI